MDPHYYLSYGENINSTWCSVGVQNITTSWYHSRLTLLEPFPSYSVDMSWGANVQSSSSPTYQLRFDNTYQSLWVLISMTSLENWSPLMYQAMTTTEVEYQPIVSPPPSPYLAFYFVFFVFFCVFFVLSLVISVCIDKFNKYRQLTGGRNLLLTEKQQQWLRVQHIMLTIKPKKKVVIPTNPIRRFCYKVSMVEAFDRFMVGLILYHHQLLAHFLNLDSLQIAIILLNVLVMLMPHEDQGEKWDLAFSAANVVFTGIFLIEMILRWTAMGLPQYFSDGWCRFDFVVVVISVIGVLMDYLSTTNTTILPILRALRVLRIFKLVPRLKSLRQMLLTILFALPALFNVGMVLFLFLYLYAILGLNIWGNLMLQNTLNQNVNFQTFTSAMLLLFRSMTGENWNAVMSDCMVLTNCILVSENVVITNSTDNSTIAVLWAGQHLDTYGDQVLISQIPSSSLINQCSISPTLAAFYFSTFVLVCTFLILQLVIGIIIESIELQYANDRLPINEKHIDSFVDTWNSLDTQGTNFVEAVYLTTILENVFHPMGIRGLKGKYKSDKLTEIIYTCDIPMRDNKINFLETLLALAYRVAGADIPAEDNENLIQKIKEVLNHEQQLPPAKFTIGHLYACLYVKCNIQGYLVRQSLRPIFSRYLEYEKELDSLRLEARSNRHLAGSQGASRPLRKLLRSGSPSPFSSNNKLVSSSHKGASFRNDFDSAKKSAPVPPPYPEIEPMENPSFGRPLIAQESKKSLFAQISLAVLSVSKGATLPSVGEQETSAHQGPEALQAEPSKLKDESLMSSQPDSTRDVKKSRRIKLPSLAKSPSYLKPPALNVEDSLSFPKLPNPPTDPAPSVVTPSGSRLMANLASNLASIKANNDS